MEQTQKRVVIDFYQGRMHAADSPRSVAQVLSMLQALDQTPCHLVGTDGFEIRRLTGDAQHLRGEFAKIRQHDIPHAGAPGGAERDLDLAEDEGLVEKNFFHYYPERQLLLYQKQGMGSSVTRLGKYLSQCCGETLAFDPLLQPDPMRRLMRGSVHARVLSIRLARPTNPAMYPADDWNHHLMAVLAGAGAMTLSLEVRGDGRTADPDRRFLSNRLKRALSELLDDGALQRAVLNIQDDAGQLESAIDLIKDRMYSVQVVEKRGRYFVAASMHEALRAAWDEKRGQLDELFGHGTNTLA